KCRPSVFGLPAAAARWTASDSASWLFRVSLSSICYLILVLSACMTRACTTRARMIRARRGCDWAAAAARPDRDQRAAAALAQQAGQPGGDRPGGLQFGPQPGDLRVRLCEREAAAPVGVFQLQDPLDPGQVDA